VLATLISFQLLSMNAFLIVFSSSWVISVKFCGLPVISDCCL
jgi:hypothetical protein